MPSCVSCKPAACLTAWIDSACLHAECTPSSCSLPSFQPCCHSPPPSTAVRNRFVVYAKADHWRTQDPSSVPPEWHGWLHYISDDNGVNVSN